MIAALGLINPLGILRFLRSREGIILMAVFALMAWTQWNRMDAARDAEAEMVQAVAEAKALAAEEWQQKVSLAQRNAALAALSDEAEMAELRGIADDLISKQTGSCIIPDDILDRLRAIR